MVPLPRPRRHGGEAAFEVRPRHRSGGRAVERDRPRRARLDPVPLPRLHRRRADVAAVVPVERVRHEDPRRVADVAEGDGAGGSPDDAPPRREVERELADLVPLDRLRPHRAPPNHVPLPRLQRRDGDVAPAHVLVGLLREGEVGEDGAVVAVGHGSGEGEAPHRRRDRDPKRPRRAGAAPGEGLRTRSGVVAADLAPVRLLRFEALPTRVEPAEGARERGPRPS